MLLLLRNEQLTIVVEQSIQTLQYLSFGKVELIKDKPVPLSDSLHQWAFSED